MFERVKLASQVLLSEELKAAYDKVLEAKRQQEERMRISGLDRQRVVEELLQREREYQDALQKRMGEAKKDGSEF